MMKRIKAASRVASIHLAGVLVLIAIAAYLIFKIWFPYPYYKTSGGGNLFLFLCAVSLICGPLLTLVLFDGSKSRSKLWIDAVLIAVIQIASLAYVLYGIAQARPVYLAYEGNRFRVVTVRDIDSARLADAQAEFRSLGYGGPRLVGAKLAETTDPNYRQSIMESLQGLHPSFRPERWVPYESQRAALQAELKPMAALKAKHPQSESGIEQALRKHGLTDDSAGYLPLDAQKADPADWVVIAERASGQPRAFLPLDGW